MGTSRSSSTPSGGSWSRVKRQITAYVADRGDAGRLVGAAVGAAGGLGHPALGGLSPGGGAARSGGRAGGSMTLGSVLTGLGGFGAALAQRGQLDDALDA